jgi:hypothetical protein
MLYLMNEDIYYVLAYCGYKLSYQLAQRQESEKEPERLAQTCCNANRVIKRLFVSSFAKSIIRSTHIIITNYVNIHIFKAKFIKYNFFRTTDN